MHTANLGWRRLGSVRHLHLESGCLPFPLHIGLKLMSEEWRRRVCHHGRPRPTQNRRGVGTVKVLVIAVYDGELSVAYPVLSRIIR